MDLSTSSTAAGLIHSHACSTLGEFMKKGYFLGKLSENTSSLFTPNLVMNVYMYTVQTCIDFYF